MCFFQQKIDSFVLLRKYLEPIDGNIKEFDEIYNEIEQHLNEILSSLEKYLPENKYIKIIERYNWLKIRF